MKSFKSFYYVRGFKRLSLESIFTVSKIKVYLCYYIDTLEQFLKRNRLLFIYFLYKPILTLCYV